MKINLAYIAGYIDGDGCFYLFKELHPIKYRSHLIIASTSFSLLESFQSSFQGSIYQLPFRKSNWKPSYHWIIRGKYALELSKQIFSFLVERKKECLNFIKFIKGKNKTNKDFFMNEIKKFRGINKITEKVVSEIRNIPIKGVTNKLDYPYLAGFIDAECCLGISKYKPKSNPNYVYKILLQCNNTNPEIFYWLMERFGGSISHVKRNVKNPRHRDQISWHLSGDKLSHLLPKILPYLRSKKEVCKKLIEFHNTTIPNGGDRQSQDFKESYLSILATREKLVKEIHLLNSKGVNNV